MTENDLRQHMVRFARSLYARGYCVGSAGNISVRLDDGFLITPTNCCLGFLEAERISKLDGAWRLIAGDAPSKEVFLHRAFYETRPQAGAVVHLHSTYATALSCLLDIDRDNTIPALTPYVVMRVGPVPLINYVAPGDPRMGELIRNSPASASAVLLANHGPVVSGRDLSSAVFAAEELEETAKLAFITQGHRARTLTSQNIAELEGRLSLR